jgi:hypothetical protein
VNDAAEDTTITVNGRLLAPAWLGVALAAGTDKGDPLFYRATSVEFFPDQGLRLTACDRHMVLTAFVPAMGEEEAEPPGLDEEPAHTLTMRDIHKRCHSLMSHTNGLPLDEGLTEEENAVEVEVSIAPADRPGWRGMEMLAMDGLDREAVQFEVPNRERLRVGVLEGEWPDWRSLVAGFVNRSTKALALSTERLGQLAQLKSYFGDRPLGLYFGGQNKALRVAIGEPPLKLTGAIMPVKWAYGLEPEPEEA